MNPTNAAGIDPVPRAPTSSNASLADKDDLTTLERLAASPTTVEALGVVPGSSGGSDVLIADAQRPPSPESATRNPNEDAKARGAARGSGALWVVQWAGALINAAVYRNDLIRNSDAIIDIANRKAAESPPFGGVLVETSAAVYNSDLAKGVRSDGMRIVGGGARPGEVYRDSPPATPPDDGRASTRYEYRWVTADEITVPQNVRDADSFHGDIPYVRYLDVSNVPTSHADF